MKTLFLHLGIHKTGTSYLQNTFRLNSCHLNDAGIVYLPLANVRENLTGRFVLERKNLKHLEGAPASGREFLTRLFDNRRAAIVSDENLLGVLYRFENGVPYPMAKRNLEKLVGMLEEECEIRIYLSVRNYGDWIESAYLQSLKNRMLIPFPEFLQRVDFAKLSWETLIAELKRAAPAAKFCVWPFEFFCRNNDGVINRFVEDIGTELPARRVDHANLSYSAPAHKLLMAAKESGVTEQHLKGLMLFIQKNLSTSNGYSKPELMPTSEKEILNVKYIQDLKRVRTMEDERFSTFGFEIFDEQLAACPVEENRVILTAQ